MADRPGIYSAVMVLWLAGIALAQPVLVQKSTPDLDRWNYPFNASDGVRESASTFGAPGDPSFDDRDAQFLLGFDTALQVLPGLAPSRYSITNATVTVTTISGGVFAFDPTTDTFETYLDPLDPLFIADADPGRPIELFGVGFRNGFTVDTFLEASAFQMAPFGFWQGTRNAFATDFDAGMPRDVSRNVEQLFTPAAFAVGQTSAVTAGSIVPSDTTFTFTLDLTNPNVVAYLRAALIAGKVRLMVTSIHQAPVMGQGAQTFPDYYTRENPFAAAFGFGATFTMNVTITSGSDLNGDGVVDGVDIGFILNQFGGPGTADLNGDGIVNGADLAIVLNDFGT